MSGPVDQGQTYRYRQTVSDGNGNPANAGTVTVTVTLPDGTTVLPSVVNSSTGVYDVAYLTSQVGLHNVKGSATGGILGSEVDVWEDAFTVETPNRMLVSVDEASNRLRAAGVITSDADREQLRWLCLVASDAVDRDLNRALTRRTVVETFSGGGSALRLRAIPVLSVTTVVESGTTLTASDYVLDDSTDLLYRGSTTSEQSWAWGRRNITVTYVAGYPDPPRSVREVALGTVQELWQTSQQAEHPLLEEQAELLVQSAVSALPGPLRGAYNKLRAAPGHA